MNRHASYAVLGVVATVALSAGTACTVTASSGDDAAVYVNEAGAEASVEDSGTSSDTGSSETGATEAASSDTGADGGGCVLPITTGAAACDQCVEAHCCPQAAACDTPGDGGVNDAGLTECEQLTGCVSDCIAADGGTSSSCFDLCKGAYSPADQQT